MATQDDVRSDLLELAERCERSSAAEQHDVLRAAFEAVHGEKPPRVHGGSAELDQWFARFNPFYSMLMAKAYESAAMTLVPEDGLRTPILPVLNEAIERCWNAVYPLGQHIGERDPIIRKRLPLFICAAALRARAHLPTTEDDNAR